MNLEEKKGCRYRLIEYTLFYLKWIDEAKSSVLQGDGKDYWNKKQLGQEYKSWSGYAFENICLLHVGKLKEALQIGGVSTRQWHWHSQGSHEGQGAEIDSVIDRADDCMNLCEIKFYNGACQLTKMDAEDLERKKRVFRDVTKTRKALFTTLITPFGASENAYFLESVEKQLTLEALF